MAPTHLAATQAVASGPVSVVGADDGLAIVTTPAPLTRLNYFDGKFLRAADLTAEQEHLRRLAHLSALAGGPGPVYGFDVGLAPGDTLRISSGFALDGLGRPLLLPVDHTVPVAALLAAAAGAASGTTPSAGSPDRAVFGDCVVPADAQGAEPVASADWWVVTIGWGEALCGEEDVYGRLCEDACSGATDRPWRVEAVVVRLEPLRLGTPLPGAAAVVLSGVHLRNRLASAIFAAEAERAGSAVSGAGLRSVLWCQGARAQGGDRVPIGVLVRSGGTTAFVDPWPVRRERIDPPPQTYWHGRLGLRPWTSFLAQVLQFQCQLRDAVQDVAEGGPADPCAPTHDAARDAGRFLEELVPLLAAAERPVLSPIAFDRMGRLRERLRDLGAGRPAATNRILIERGFVELPPAGYLPVDPGTGVEAQVRALLGDGVDVRFCTARPDVIAQAFQGAQHLARISLTAGLDAPSRRHDVDVLVPDGVHDDTVAAPPVRAWAAELKVLPLVAGEVGAGRTGLTVAEKDTSVLSFSGLATADTGRLGSAQLAGMASVPRGVGLDFLEAVTFLRPNRLEVERLVDDQHAAVTDETLIRFRSLAGRASAFSAARLAGAESGRFAPPLEPGEARAAAAWLDLRLDADLLQAGTGDRVPFEMRIVLVSPARSNLVLDRLLRGTFVVATETTGPGGAKVLRGQVPDATARDRRVVDGVEQQDEQTGGDLEATVTVSAGADGTRALQIGVGTDGVERVVARLTWAAGDATTRATLVASRDEADRITVGDRLTKAALPLGSLTLVDDASVLEPAHARNQLARSAVKVVAAGAADASLAEDVLLKRLLPPPAPATSRIRATRDWVMFHRRAEVSCTGARPPAPPATRRLVLHAVTLDDVSDLRALRDDLVAGRTDVARKLGMRRLDVVEFTGVTMATPAAAVASTWRAAQAGDVVVHSAVGAVGEGDGAGASTARVAAIHAALVGTATIAPQALVDVLPVMPAGLAEPGLDGAVILAATVRLETTCVEVRRLNVDGLDILMKALRTGADVAEVVEAALGMERLGEVTFRDATAVSGLAEVAGAWASAGGVPGQAFLVVGRGDAAAGTAADRTARVATITEVLGRTIPAAELEASRSGADCPAVLLLMPASDQPVPVPVRAPGMVLFGLRGLRTSVRALLDDPTVIDESRLDEVVAEGAAVPLGFVVFKPGSTEFAGPFTVRRLSDANLPKQVAFAFGLFHKDTFTDDPAVMPEQLAVAARVVEGVLDPASAKPIEVPAPPTTSREVVALLVFDVD